MSHGSVYEQQQNLDQNMISTEQQSILTDVAKGYSVVVTAYPGAGKTTTACKIVESFPHPAMLITYNRALADATRLKLELFDCEVYTIHGLASKIMGSPIHDELMLSLMFRDHTIDWSRIQSPIELLILDECQDMRPIYIRFMKRFLKECCSSSTIQFVVLGDVRQLLYDFYEEESADERFLTHAEQIFGHMNRTWVTYSLTQSWRCTRQLAAVINKIVPTRQMLPRDEDGPPVVIFCCDVRQHGHQIVANLVTQSPCVYADITILLASLNTRSPAKDIVAALVAVDVPVFVIRSGDMTDTISQDLQKSVKGRVCLRTFHSSKGLESKYIIVINLRPISNLLENPNYVAWTRSSYQLIVIQQYTETSLHELTTIADGLSSKELRIILYNEPPEHLIPTNNIVQPVTVLKHLHITSMFSFSTSKRIEHLLGYIQTKQEESILFDDLDLYEHSMIVSFDQEETFVNVLSLCGAAILAMYEYSVHQALPRKQFRQNSKLDALYTAATTSLATKPWYSMFMIAVYNDAMKSGYLDRVYNIQNYTFASNIHLERRYSTLLTILGDVKVNFNMSKKIRHENVLIHGLITMYTAEKVLYCIHKPSISKEDILVGTLLSIAANLPYTSIINLFSGEHLRVQCTAPSCFLAHVVQPPATTRCKQNDDEFIMLYS